MLASIDDILLRFISDIGSGGVTVITYVVVENERNVISDTFYNRYKLIVKDIDGGDYYGLYQVGKEFTNLINGFNDETGVEINSDMYHDFFVRISEKDEDSINRCKSYYKLRMMGNLFMQKNLFNRLLGGR